MRLRLAPLLGAAALLALAGCGGEKEPAPPPEIAATGGSDVKAGPVVESEYGTPVKDRVATLGFLNKRNNISQDITLKSGESKRIGNVIVKLATCERSLPWEEPQTGAFVQVYVEERASTQEKLAWHKVFSGWLFKESPSLNVVQHPVYDVWVKDCAMKFPGEEGGPAPAASSSSAAKPAGSSEAPKSGASPSPAASASASPSPAPTPKPSPKPSAKPSPSPAASGR
jgi:hypothetical protein